MTAWECSECGSKNPASTEGRFCRACGSPRNAAVSERPQSNVWKGPWQAPDWRRSKPEDLCPECGDGTTVRDHIEQFRAIVSKPNTMLSRPSQREQPKHEVNEELLESRRVILLEQARQLRGEK